MSKVTRQSILNLKADGYTNRRIADLLGIHINTVDYHFNKKITQTAKSSQGVGLPTSDIERGQWYLLPDGRFGLILSDGGADVGVHLCKSIVRANLNDADAVHEYSKLHIRMCWKRWDAARGKTL